MKNAELRRDGTGVGVLYGFLAEIKRLESRFNSRRFVFAFDSKRSLRKEKYPWYKMNRQNNVHSELAKHKKDIRRQMTELGNGILTDIGFENVFSHDGYEADDVIARAADAAYARNDNCVIISSDEDLYQLVSHRCVQFKPFNKEMINEDVLFERFDGIIPHDWPMVKALAGCTSDTVPGIRGVGEVYAARWIAGKTIPSRLKSAIDAYVAADRHKPALEVVKLPYPGCPPVKLLEDVWSDRHWNRVVKKLGMESLLREINPCEPLSYNPSR